MRASHRGKADRAYDVKGGVDKNVNHYQPVHPPTGVLKQSSQKKENREFGEEDGRNIGGAEDFYHLFLIPQRLVWGFLVAGEGWCKD